MNRAKIVKDIIEGFKLGKLGAGKLKMAPETQPSQIEIPNILFADVWSGSYEGFMRGVTWSEDEMNFYLQLTGSRSGETYDLLLYGGRGDRVKIPRKNMTIKKLPKLPDFSLQLKFFAKDRGEASEKMNAVMRSIKTAGSFGLAWEHSSIFSSGWSLNDHGYFKEYLKI
jgi:hypothetical protein